MRVPSWHAGVAGTLLGGAALGSRGRSLRVAAIVEHVDVARIAATPVDLQGRLVGGADFNEDGRTDLAVLVGGDTVGTLAIWYSE